MIVWISGFLFWNIVFSSILDNRIVDIEFIQDLKQHDSFLVSLFKSIKYKYVFYVINNTIRLRENYEANFLIHWYFIPVISMLGSIRSITLFNSLHLFHLLMCFRGFFHYKVKQLLMYYIIWFLFIFHDIR